MQLSRAFESAFPPGEKNCYYVSFVPGMEKIIAGVIRERLPGVAIIKLLAGAAIFETACTYDRLNFFCFNNIFSLIDIWNVPSKNSSDSPGLHIRKITEGKVSGPGALSPKALAVISENNKKIKTFRVVCSLENKPASVDETARRAIENFITRNSVLKPDRSRPDTEFWFLYRREGFSLFMKRLTRSVEKKLRAGELSPQLAWLLCRAAGLKPGETALDPFSGYGSVPEAALKHFPVEKFFALDIDPRCVKITRERQSLKNSRFEIHIAGIFDALDFFSESAVDAIITDPPWGMYRETEIPLAEFYEKTLAVFSKLLKPGGRAVVLTGARREFEYAVNNTPAFTLGETIPVLVSGKKAAVYVLTKNLQREPRVESPLQVPLTV